MREYVRRGQEQVNGASGFLLPKSRSQVWLRNQFIRVLPYMPWKGLIAGGVQKAADAITLKEYAPIASTPGPGDRPGEETARGRAIERSVPEGRSVGGPADGLRRTPTPRTRVNQERSLAWLPARSEAIAVTQMRRLCRGADRERLVLVAEDDLVPTSATALTVPRLFRSHRFARRFGTTPMDFFLSAPSGPAVAVWHDDVAGSAELGGLADMLGLTEVVCGGCRRLLSWGHRGALFGCGFGDDR